MTESKDSVAVLYTFQEIVLFVAMETVFGDTWRFEYMLKTNFDGRTYNEIG